MEPVISFKGVSKSYPLYHHVTGGFKNFVFHMAKGIRSLRHSRFEVLRDVSFDVFQGEALGIVGRNGSGKSTTLGLIAGVLKPSSGTVTARGRISPLLELGAGFHPELSGRENIVLNGVLMGLTRAAVKRKMEEIIEFSEIEEFIDQPIRVYSSGMVARLGFSVIAHLDPEILLIDEILAVGDLQFQKKCLDKMLAFRASNVTMVFVSHKAEDIGRLCNRVMWIDNHVVRMIGTTAEVLPCFVSFTEGRGDPNYPRRRGQEDAPSSGHVQKMTE